jgi:hypothetical protein
MYAYNPIRRDQQRLNHISTAKHIGDLSQQVQLGNTECVQTITGLRPEMTNILALVRPVANEMPKISTTLSALISSVDQLVRIAYVCHCSTKLINHQEQRISDISPIRVSAKAIEEDIGQICSLRQRMKRGGSKDFAKRSQYSPFCHCRPQTEEATIFSKTSHGHGHSSIKRTRVREHSSECWLGAYGNTRTILLLRLSMCSLLLRRKFDFAIEVRRGTGTLWISPALQTYRIVDVCSPGFNLIVEFMRERKWMQSSAADYFWKQLLNLFQHGEASPFDRLPNGITLLHVCVLFHSCYILLNA